ncbi:MAG: EscU/YscU/HrcU family type III secretion system export apparatus switch protein [Longimicrobiales bacterium]
MAEETPGDKTEAPTPKRRRDAAEKGQVPRSQEVTTAFLLLAGAAALSFASGPLAYSVVDLFEVSARGITVLPVGVEGLTGYLRELGGRTLASLAPILLILSGVALAVSAAQGRGVLTLKPLEPKWDKLDPFKKAKQIWGTRAVAELAKSFAKLGIVGTAVWVSLDSAMADLPALGQSDPFALLVVVRIYAVRMLLSAGIAYLALALADYAFQIHQHEKQLKMSREDIKKESKEAEGDQVVKVRRRTMARQFARRRMLLAVSEADVVVTNPTHIAVALKYDPAKAEAPIVLAMGERKMAQRIKEIAREKGVPTVENKPLARALFATATVGASIPVDLFVAVAEVLAFVYKNRGRKPAGAARTPSSASGTNLGSAS